ncbi:leucyl aminopeptidase [Nocardioides euryhalodurans]|uniref:Probable cytosol aminopeptidase n=1 Tax=Nocardioides euryhalodurans TaxID=2518370 RepID=A0A4P7GNP3_9ACTN|nr:leucyl aminopeptidase [Nocardioides euryhalodurans]QBR93710.1 leucyl aminopeptidase [Nocardioides euryhalodurans]
MPNTLPLSLPAQVSPPEFALSALAPHAVSGVEVVALPVVPATDDGAPLLGPGADALAEALDLDLLGLLESQQATGRTGEVTTCPVPLGSADNAALRLVLLVGVGDQSAQDLRRAGAALARAVRDRSSVATSVAAVCDAEGLTAFVVGLTLGSFGFHMRSDGPEHRPVEQVVLAGLPDDADLAVALHRGITLGGAGWRARMLATVPSNIKNPQWLAEQAEEIAQEAGLDVTVWDEKRLAAEGFGGIVGVGQASATPPRLIRLDYVPRGGRKAPRVVLVGKGITFDTGGLSIKPAEGMTTMKRDMTGGAVVLSVLAALAALDCPVRVTGLVAAAENAVGGDAMRPGDVLRHYGGRTTEVTNTDAEGRLVMADALAYAVAELDPAVVVDVATLTGAMKVALGQSVGGFFANRDGLADVLREAGDQAGEPLWRFPLVGDYEQYLESKVADADNGPKHAGAISAALFLQHFVGQVPWAHLDVASVGDAPSDRHEWTAGPTGFGARVLLGWLTGPDPLDGVVR